MISELMNKPEVDVEKIKEAIRLLGFNPDPPKDPDAELPDMAKTFTLEMYNTAEPTKRVEIIIDTVGFNSINVGDILEIIGEPKKDNQVAKQFRLQWHKANLGNFRQWRLIDKTKGVERLLKEGESTKKTVTVRINPTIHHPAPDEGRYRLYPFQFNKTIFYGTVKMEYLGEDDYVGSMKVRPGRVVNLGWDIDDKAITKPKNEEEEKKLVYSTLEKLWDEDAFGPFAHYKYDSHTFYQHVMAFDGWNKS